MKNIIINEIAIYNDKLDMVIGYELQKMKLNKHGFYQIIKTKRILF